MTVTGTSANASAEAAPAAQQAVLLRRIRGWLIVFIVGLVLSGVTAFPLVTEVRWGHELLVAWNVDAWLPGLVDWFALVRRMIKRLELLQPGAQAG